MQTNTPIRYHGQMHCLNEVIARSGHRSVYKGTFLTYCRDMPSFSVYFLTYEYLQDCFKATDGTFSPVATLISGGLAGVAGWGLAIPMDTVKNRHQSILEPSSSVQAVQSLFRSEGIGGFYRGARPILLRAFPANAAAFLGYEAAISLLSR